MSIKTATLGAVSLFAAAAFAAPAFADGMPGHGRIATGAPSETRPCSVAANVGVTSDYVFRGVSQNLEEPAIQGGVDLTCGRFYFGVWGSSVDGETAAGVIRGNTELDVYGGYKFATGPVSWDVGVIYYYYPGPLNNFDNVELKLGASGDIWKGGTLGGTIFYSPENEYYVLEGSFAQTLPKFNIFSPTVGATVGKVEFDNGGDYTYWNIGLTLGFMDKWSVDLRYWDTNIDGGCPLGSGVNICDDRFVGTVKYTF